MVNGTVNLTRLWYPLMYREIHDIWFLKSYWLTRIVRGDFVVLVVGFQEISGKWIKNNWKILN